MPSTNGLSKLKIVQALCHGVIDQLLRMPLVFFSLLILIYQTSIKATVFLFVSMWGTYLINKAISLNHDARTLLNLCRYLSLFKVTFFTNISIQDILVKYGDSKAKLHIIRPNTTVESIGNVYFVDYLKTGYGNDTPTNFTSYPLNNFPSIVISPDSPDHYSDKNSFDILHEFGHLGMWHLKTETVFITNVLLGFVIMFFCFVCEVHNIFAVCLLMFSILLWILNSYYLQLQFKNEGAESIADAYALFCLKDNENYDKIKSDFKNQFSGDRRVDVFEHLQNWMTDPVNVEKHISKYTSSQFIINHFSNLKINHNSLIEKYYTPSGLISLILFCSIIFASYFNNNISIESIILSVMAIIFVPMFFVLRYEIWCQTVMRLIKGKYNLEISTKTFNKSIETLVNKNVAYFDENNIVEKFDKEAFMI